MASPTIVLLWIALVMVGTLSLIIGGRLDRDETFQTPQFQTAHLLRGAVPPDVLTAPPPNSAHRPYTGSTTTLPTLMTGTKPK
jgi:hypothetical protein